MRNNAMDLWARTFNAIKDIVTIQDKDLKIIRANKATYQFFQVENGTLTGKHCYEVFTGKTEPCAGCPLLVTIRNGIDHETIIKHENLNKIFRISSSLIPAENSEEEYLVHIARDITKDLESKYIIRESNKRFAKAFKSNPVPMAISEIKSGVFVDVDQQWIEMLGFERLELIDKTSEEVGIWEDIADREGLIATLCAKAAVKEYPIVLRARTGESRSVLWSAEVITVDGRDLMLSLVNDITEHRKNELKRSIFLELLNNAGHIIVFKDQQLRYVLINQAYTTLTGHTLADVIGKTDREVFEGISAPEHIDAYIANDRHALALPQGQGLTEEEHMLASDGSTRTFLTKKFPVYAQDGQLLGVGTITSEITKLKQVEQALRESEERARLLSDLTMEGIVIHKQAVAIEINSSMARMLGFLREELLGKNFMGLFHKEDLRKVLENIKKEYAAPYTVRMTRKNGEYFFAEIESHNFKQNGEVWRVSAIRDITERKRLEDALRENEFFFRESQRIGFIGSYAANFVTGYWKSSEVLDQIFGIDENYTRSVQGWMDIVHPDDRAMMNEYLEKEVIAQKKPFNKEYRIIRKSDGVMRWVKGYGNVESGADGNVISMIGTIQDITERKQSERSLQEREAYYRSLFNNSLIGVTVTDKNFVISDANDAFLNMLGYSRREFVGKMTISDVSHPDDATKSLDMLNKLKRHDIEYFVLEKRYISKTGKIVPSLIYVKGIYDSNEEYNGTSSAILDITERKRAEDMLAENEAKNIAPSSTTLKLPCSYQRLMELKHWRPTRSFSI